MAIGQAGSPWKSIEALWVEGTLTGMEDRQLLERYTAGGGPSADAAFATLVHRHGPMVLRVCRQMLGDGHAAEDAFQATFLVLTRKAGSLRRPEFLGRWLYGVAVRTARRARSRSEGGLGPEAEALVGDQGRHELRLIRLEEARLLHRELDRLPEKYRAPLILCYLEGLTHQEAARRLRCPSGTLSVRLMRAKDVLRSRLTRRGLAPAAAASAAFAADACRAATIPAALADATIRSVTAGLPGQAPVGVAASTAAALARSVLLTGRIARFWAGSALVMAVALGVGMGVAGARWLSPEEDLDARSAAFAATFARPVRPEPSGPRQPTIPVTDPGVRPAPGYFWVGGFEKGPGLWWDSIITTSPGAASGPISGDIVQVDDGSLRFAIVHRADAEDPPLREYRPVAFGSDGVRHVPRWEGSAACTSEVGGRACLEEFRLDRADLPAEKIARVLVERMTSETRRHAVRVGPPIPGPGDDRGSPSGDVGRFPAAAEHTWSIPPRPVGDGRWTASASGARGGVLCDVTKDRRGTLRILLAYPSRTPVDTVPDPLSEYRLVFLDARGRRYLLGVHRIPMPLLDDRELEHTDSMHGYWIMEAINAPGYLNIGRYRCPDHPEETVFVRDPLISAPHRPVTAFNLWGERRSVESELGFASRKAPVAPHLADVAVYHCANPAYACLEGAAEGPPLGPSWLGDASGPRWIGVERMEPRAFQRARIEALAEWSERQRRTGGQDRGPGGGIAAEARQSPREPTRAVVPTTDRGMQD